MLCSSSSGKQHPGALPHPFTSSNRYLHQMVERETCTKSNGTTCPMVPYSQSPTTIETFPAKLAPSSPCIPSPMPHTIFQNGIYQARSCSGPSLQSQTGHGGLVNWTTGNVLLHQVGTLQISCPQPIGPSLRVSRVSSSLTLTGRLGCRRRRLLAEQGMEYHNQLKLGIHGWTKRNGLPSMPNSDFRFQPTSLDRALQKCHLSHHQILHHRMSTNLRGHKQSSIVKTNRLLPWEFTALACTTKQLGKPFRILPFSNLHLKVLNPSSHLLSTFYIDNMEKPTLGLLETGDNCQQMPAGYILAKKKKDFRSGRPIISFVDSRFRPMLNILARMIFQLMPVACPNHFASGDVNTLLSILKSAPVDADLILVNQELAGFFTSIDQDRFIGAWFMLLDFLRPNMNVSDNEVFSVYPGKINNPGDIIKGRTFRRPNVARKITIKDVPELLKSALNDMQTFVLGQKCSRQCRGSPMGSPLSPALCLMVVSISEQIWPINFKQILGNHHLFIRHKRCVDNRLIFGDSRLQDLPHELLLDEGFYGKPMILETEPDQEFLGFMLETKPLELIYQGPTNISQVLSPFSASPPKVLLSGFRSRCHVVAKGAFHDFRVRQGIDQVIQLYTLSQWGTPHHFLSDFDSASEPSDAWAKTVNCLWLPRDTLLCFWFFFGGLEFLVSLPSF